MRRSLLALLIATVTLAHRVDAARPLPAALRFSQNSSNRVDLGNSAAVAGNTTFTWALWARRTADQSGASGFPLIGRGVFNTSFDATVTIARSGGASPNKLNIFVQLSTASVNLVGTSSLVLNHWYFIAASFDGSVTAQLMVFSSPDGEPEIVTGSGTGTFNAVSTHHLWIGNNTDSAVNAPGMDCALVQVYNRVLTKAEAGSLYRNPNAKILGLQGTWRPGTNGTGAVLDESGNVHHGILTGAIPISDAPAIRGYTVIR